MDFSDVNVEAILGELAQFKEELMGSSEKSQTSIEGLSKTENWKCETGEVLLSKIELFPEAYQKVIDKLGTCETILQKIGEHQENKKKLKELQSEYSSVEAELEEFQAQNNEIGDSDLLSRLGRIRLEIMRVEEKLSRLENEIRGMSI